MSLKNLISKILGSKPILSKRKMIDRAPRVRVNYLHALEFYAREPLFSAPLKIDNISSSGIGLLIPNDANHAELQTISGDLVFASGSVHALTLKIVRFNGDHVGATIENATPGFILALKTYFESELAALRLKATRADLLKAVSHGTPHWFQGNNNCDLAYVSNGSEVIEFSISVFGNHIEGGEKKRLCFSEISEKVPGERAGYRASDLLNQKNMPDAAMLIFAKRVISAVEGLPDDHRASILKYLIMLIRLTPERY